MQIIENAVYMGAATPGQGGSAPVIDELNVTPSTSAQVITAPEGTDGYSPVNVSAVDSTIDANIVAGNIKKDVQILGVTGSYEGQTPTGTMYIISNGTYNVADKAIANVNVPTTAPAHYIEKTVDANGKLINSTNIINLTGVTDISQGCLYNAYKGVSFPANTSVDFSSLTTISETNACSGMFSGCSGIVSVDLGSLTTISGQNACSLMFQNDTQITSIDLSALTSISGQTACSSMFSGCSGIVSAGLGSLTTISGQDACYNMFSGCSGITSIDLSALTSISGQRACYQMFQNNTQISSIDLSALTTISEQNACYQMFDSCSGATSVDLSALTTISSSNSCQQMFQNDTHISNIDFSGLQTIGGYLCCSQMFKDCTSITSVVFPSLTVLSGGSCCSAMFHGCSSLTSLSFPALTSTSFGSAIVNQFYNLILNTNGCTLHFPSNLDPQSGSTVISSLATYPNFGGTNTVLAFDLPATE